jgi:hypothetical protein
MKYIFPQTSTEEFPSLQREHRVIELKFFYFFLIFGYCYLSGSPTSTLTYFEAHVVKTSVADPHHLDADSNPDPAFHFDADPDPDLTLSL